MADKKRMRHSRLRDAMDAKPRRKRSAPQAPPVRRRQTHYDVEHMPLHCNNCGRIYNGPHFGEVVETGSPEYRAIDEEQRKLRGPDSLGAISDTLTCNKRSCIDTYAKGHYDMMRHKYQDRDWDESEREFREAQYNNVRNNPEQFPEGLIDDVDSREGGE